MGAFGWGALAASSLLIGGLLALVAPPGKRVLGLVMAAGVGVLTSAVAYELVEESFEVSAWGVTWGLLAGSVTFYLGDLALDHWGGDSRKRSTQAPANVGAMAIVLGIVLDGIPESIVLGLSLITHGTIGVAVLVAVFISNLPESIAATVGLRAQGWRRSRLILLWAAAAVVSGIASAAGFTLFDGAGPDAAAFVNAFAGGAVLTMLADTMAPEAFENGGPSVGLATSVGFLGAFLLHALP